MKKLILISLSVLLIFSISACGNNETSNTPTGSQSSNEKTIFEKFEDGLNELNIEFQKTVTAAEMIGAVQGIRYKLVDGNVELYMFDVDSDSLAKAKENKAVTLEGFGNVPAEINNNFALIIDEVEKKDDIISLFKSLK